jgi:hypothetical protein
LPLLIAYAGINNEVAELDLSILGWYHSHPSRGLFLHDVDIVNQLSYQQCNPDMLALVVDQMLVSEAPSKIAVFSLKSSPSDYCIIDANGKYRFQMPEYYKLEWVLEEGLDAVKVEGRTIEDLRRRELKKS